MFDQADIPVWKGGLGSWTLRLERQPLSACDLNERYGQIAAKWDALLHRLAVPSCYAAVLRRAIARMGDVSHMPRTLCVLDAGAGTGALSKAFSDEWGSPLDINLVDVSPDMLVKAQAVLAPSVTSCTAQVADMRRLPQGRSSQDVVLCAHAVEHLPDPALALSEFHRVLKPGGWLLVSLTPPTLFGWLVHLRWRARLFRMGEAVSHLAEAGFEAIQHIETDRGTLGSEQRYVLIARKPETQPFRR